jgi:hypothetical protein
VGLRGERRWLCSETRGLQLLLHGLDAWADYSPHLTKTSIADVLVLPINAAKFLGEFLVALEPLVDQFAHTLTRETRKMSAMHGAHR